MEMTVTTDEQGDQAGWPRRDVLKAIAMLAATPLAAQASRAVQPSTGVSDAVVAAGKRDQPFAPPATQGQVTMSDEAAHPSAHPFGGYLALPLLVSSFEHAKRGSKSSERSGPRDAFQVLLLDQSGNA